MKLKRFENFTNEYYYIDCNDQKIINGDIIDIKQTINGQNLFVIMNLYPLDIRYEHDISRKYEYDKESLLKKCPFSGLVEYEIVGNIFVNESKELYNFLDKFKDEPKDWSEATGELSDLHKIIAELYNEYTGENYSDHLGYSSSPEESIKRHKEGIKELFPKLRKIDKEYVIDFYSHWFN